MDNELRKQLKMLRVNAKISASKAGRWAGVDERTWRSWEASGKNNFYRSPSKSALWCFFYRCGVKIPPEFKTYLNLTPLGRCLSITSYKGGVGKSPITVNVGACLTQQGYSVAIVSDDGVFRGMRDDNQKPAQGSLVSRIDFYDERDLITFPSEIKKLEKEIRDNVDNAPPQEREMLTFIYGGSIARLDRKKRNQEIK